jgi:hypothetical protein
MQQERSSINEGQGDGPQYNPCHLNENETHYIAVLDPCDPDLCTDRLVSDHELPLTMSVSVCEMRVCVLRDGSMWRQIKIYMQTKAKLG